jgi:hypothetical protein
MNNSSFKLVPFAENTDVDLIHDQVELLIKGESITDTIQISSKFLKTQGLEGFSNGTYRIRMVFNKNGSYNRKSMFTKWKEFSI